MKKTAHENLASLYKVTPGEKIGEEVIGDKTNEQKQESVYRCLERAVEVIEEDIKATPHVMMKRIEADAAIVVTLNIVSELLPAHVQEQVKKVITLHDEVWKMDTLSPGEGTPRKPLVQGLQHWVLRITSMAQK
jgi:hypothetical protein